MLNWIIHSIQIVTVGVFDVLQVKIMFNSLLTGPSQKFLILLQWSLSLVKTLGGPSNLQPAITVAYDNICSVEKMRITRKALPLPLPYKKLWMCFIFQTTSVQLV